MHSIVHPADWRTYWLGGQRQAVIADASQTNGRFALSHSTIVPGGGARAGQMVSHTAARVRRWAGVRTPGSIGYFSGWGVSG
jgi:hypothetical protein